MARVEDLSHILVDCVLAVGQAVGPHKTVDFDAVVWWYQRYRHAFRYAMTARGASWAADRHRVTAVGRHLGQRVVAHTLGRDNVDVAAAARASVEVERGCQMHAARATSVSADCTDSALTAFSS